MEPYEIKSNSLIMTRLIAHALNDSPLQCSDLQNVDMGDLYKAARMHSLTAMTAYALKKSGLDCPEQFRTGYYQAQRLSILVKRERSKVIQELEKNRIRYMPLKGIVISSLYPMPFLREMGDNDILYDASRASDVRRIMHSLQYEEASYLEHHHDVYCRKPYFVFEMHRSLFDEAINQKAVDYYQDVFDRLQLREGFSYCYEFSKEDFYVYHVIHAKIHYDTAGTGLRTLLDNYLLRRSVDDRFDRSYVRAQLAQLDADRFEKKLTAASDSLFSEKAAPDDIDIDEFIMYGTHGTMRHLRENMVASWLDDEKGTKAGYIGKRLSDSRATLAQTYPIVNKYKVLQPILVSYRVIRRFVSKPKQVLQEMKYLIHYHSD